MGVRDRRDGLWLDLWVDSDHAEEPGRRSTSGWVLMLRGKYGAKVPLDWASRKQGAVARSSGEAETVALDEALRGILGVNRGLCSAGLPIMDALEKILGVELCVRVLVDASVCKTAAEKGTSTQMKYISKSQGVDLFWLRDVVQRAGVKLDKVGSADNLADLLTKPLHGKRVQELSEKVGMAFSSTG